MNRAVVLKAQLTMAMANGESKSEFKDTDDGVDALTSSEYGNPKFSLTMP